MDKPPGQECDDARSLGLTDVEKAVFGDRLLERYMYALRSRTKFCSVAPCVCHNEMDTTRRTKKAGDVTLEPARGSQRALVQP